jgi:hypothetical protein
MKTLYVGTLDPSGTCFSRLEALRAIEGDVHTFDTDEFLPFEERSYLARSVERHLVSGPTYNRGNRALLAMCADLRPDLIWVDKGDWIRRSTLHQLRSLGCFLVHHITDSLYTRHARSWFRRRLMRSTRPDYDIFFTTNIDDHAAIVDQVPPTALLTHLGYDDRRFDASALSAELVERWRSEIRFIGHYERQTGEVISALCDAQVPIQVNGPGSWSRESVAAKLGDRLGGPLWGEDYVHALKGAKIGLCVVSVINYNQTAARSGEIPATGTFLLAIRTPQHLEMYEEGVEAEFFGDHAELIDKARYYLEHDEEREQIARRGCARARASGYSWEALMKRDWSRVRELYQARRDG